MDMVCVDKLRQAAELINGLLDTMIYIETAEQDILMRDRRFAGLQKQIWEQMKKLETSGMDMQQSLAVEGLIS